MADFSSEDIRFMSLAIREAGKALGRTRPNPAVGAVIVRDGKIVGKGYHRKAGTPHAEVNAIQDAGPAASGADMYVTLEPCNHEGKTPPCAEAVLKAGIKRVVIGALDPNPEVKGGGMKRLLDAGIECLHGCLEVKCMRLVAPFVKHVITGRPWVICKVACSMDGRIATRTGHSRWITGKKARMEGHVIRNVVDAIVVGRGTVQADDPSLTCRLEEGRDPVRIVLDSHLACSPESRVFSQRSGACPVIACLEDVAESRIERFRQKGVKIMFLPPGKSGGVDLVTFLEKCGAMGMQSLLVEGGAGIHGSFWDMQLVDEAFFFYAPKVIGGVNAMPGVGGVGVSKASDAALLEHVRHKKLDSDWLVSGVVSGHLHALWSG